MKTESSVWLALLLALLGVACERSAGPITGGETHFLSRCESTCEGGLECVSGVCSRPCDSENDSICTTLNSKAECTDTLPEAEGPTCDVGCTTDRDCRTLSLEHRCDAGFCRASDSNSSPQANEPDASPQVNELDASDVANGLPPADKLDLLFVVDNSILMADKQQLLARSVPRLLERLVNPRCADAAGTLTQPDSASASCPAGSAREFAPVTDIHVGVITSSMGDAGANDACGEPESVDKGYLLGALPRGQAALGVPVDATASGVLSFNGNNLTEFQAGVQAQIASAGERGCGFEAPLEALYHFLIDPTPWSSIDSADCAGQPSGSKNCRQPVIPDSPDGVLGDPLILAQRAAFLRPDSVLGVVMLTDENDCSIIVGGPYNVASQTNTAMFRGSSVCETDSNDPCCYSCGTAPPSGCASDPVCAEGTLSPSEDEANLRCYDQKRRFGLDFLYPVQRYVNALTARTLGLCRLDLDSAMCVPSEVVLNPLYAAPATRDPSRVVVAGIVGVPWQLLQATTDEAGVELPSEELHFMTANQLGASAGSDATFWDRIVGPSDVRDVHMLEAIATSERPGVPGADAAFLADPVVGHDWRSSEDLQNACIFPLEVPRDCDNPGVADTLGCDCVGAGEPGYDRNSPLCQAEDGTYSSVQRFAKAHPSLRQLEVLREVSERSNAVVGSICPRNVSDDARQDFAYDPVVDSVIAQMRPKLVGGS